MFHLAVCAELTRGAHLTHSVLGLSGVGAFARSFAEAQQDKLDRLGVGPVAAGRGGKQGAGGGGGSGGAAGGGGAEGGGRMASSRLEKALAYNADQGLSRRVDVGMLSTYLQARCSTPQA